MSNPDRDRRCGGGLSVPDGRACIPDAFAQIARFWLPVGADADRRHIGPDRRDVVRHSGSQELGCGWRRAYHSGFVETGGPVAIAAPVDDRAVTQPVGGDDDRTGNLELLLQRRCHGSSTRRKGSTEDAAAPVTHATRLTPAGPVPTRPRKRASVY